MNLEDLIARRGLDRIGFVTLTFKENLTCRIEAQRRFNSLATNVLRPNVAEFVVTVERQQRGAIHYHLIAAFPYDIRSGFDFETCCQANLARKQGNDAEHKRLQAIYSRSANDNLRAWWVTLRRAASRYGFGRCETLPVLSNSEALSRYVGTYVGCEYVNRQARDKGMRTIRYSLDRRAASVRWQWVNGNGEIWRRGCKIMSIILRTEEFAEALGKRWAWNFRAEISVFGRFYDQCMQVVGEVSDHLDLVDRLARVARLAEFLWDYETANCAGGDNAAASASA